MDGIELMKPPRLLIDGWTGESFMAIGLRDGISKRTSWKSSAASSRPEAMDVPEAGHFVQEYGGPIAKRVGPFRAR